MNRLLITGLSEINIEFTPLSLGHYNPDREAALLAENLLWYLPPNTMSKVLDYLTKKIVDLQVDAQVKNLHDLGETPITINHKDGNKTVTTEADISNGDEENDYESSEFLDDDDDNENLEDEDGWNIPDE